MTDLILSWQNLTREFRKQATECETETARRLMLARAETLERCTVELIAAYLEGGNP